MRLMIVATTVLLLAATVQASAQFGGGGDCQALWVERNTYYKQAGYCFRTRRAIEYFGNQGCYIYNEAQIVFPPHVRRRIQEIIRLERALGCPR
jgi:hypothetical protein